MSFKDAQRIKRDMVSNRMERVVGERWVVRMTEGRGEGRDDCRGTAGRVDKGRPKEPVTSSHKQVTHPSMTGRLCGSGQRGPKCSFGLSAIPHLDRRGHAPSAVGLGACLQPIRRGMEKWRRNAEKAHAVMHSRVASPAAVRLKRCIKLSTGTQQDGGLGAMRASEFGIMETRRINSDKEPTEFPGSSESLVTFSYGRPYFTLL